jgi:hypothetical protein
MSGDPHAADLNRVFNVVDHGETADGQNISQGYDTMGTVDTESFHQLGANLHLKIQSLPILDNLVRFRPATVHSSH